MVAREHRRPQPVAPSPEAVPCTISAIGYDGLSVTTADGRPAMLAVIDGDGNIVASGPGVQAAAWEASIKAYRNFLIGSGHLRVQTKPPGLGG